MLKGFHLGSRSTLQHRPQMSYNFCFTTHQEGNFSSDQKFTMTSQNCHKSISKKINVFQPISSKLFLGECQVANRDHTSHRNIAETIKIIYKSGVLSPILACHKKFLTDKNAVIRIALAAESPALLLVELLT